MNEPKIDKYLLSAKVPIELAAKTRGYAVENGLHFSDCVLLALELAFGKREISKDGEEWTGEMKRKAMEKRMRNRGLRPRVRV